MKVAWLQDPGNADGSIGGAELTCDEFLSATPPGVTVVRVPPDQIDLADACDKAVFHNVVSYPANTVERLGEIPLVKYWHDTGPWLSPQLAQAIYRLATPIFCSPIQAAYMGFPEGRCIPPAVNLAPFREARENAGERRGSVTVGAWMNWGKSPERAREVAPDVDFFGSGPCAPAGSVAVDYEALPELLARYRTFIHLPSVLEPFGRAVVEAYAAGCQVITNNLVGARYWIREQPEKLDTASTDFWETVLA